MTTQKAKLEIIFQASNEREAQDLFNWMIRQIRKYIMAQDNELYAVLEPIKESEKL